MTTACNIFKTKATMPSEEATEIGTPVQTRMSNKSPAGAMATYRTEPQHMAVASVERPRRGHDY